MPSEGTILYAEPIVELFDVIQFSDLIDVSESKHISWN